MTDLVIAGLRKSFATVDVLSGVDLTVPSGSLAAVLGPSGCGKTTLLRIVAGFERPDDGSVRLAGRTVSSRSVHLPPEKRRIGIVPQEGALFPHLSVAGNVGFGLKSGAGRSRRVDELLELVGLGGFGVRMPSELSGGQQQRVALARALAPEPALVLLDEPFSALDSGLRAAVREDVRAALRAAGATAVLVTHDQQEALSMADQVAVMRDGAVVQCASPAELYAGPHDVGIATFVGDAVVLPAVRGATGLKTALGLLTARAGSSSGVLEAGSEVAGSVVVRPEQVAVVAGHDGVPARVLGTSFFGHDALVHVEVDGQPALVVSARSSGATLPLPGDVVRLQVVGEVAFFPSTG